MKPFQNEECVEMDDIYDDGGLLFIYAQSEIHDIITSGKWN